MELLYPEPNRPIRHGAIDYEEVIRFDGEEAEEQLENWKNDEQSIWSRNKWERFVFPLFLAFISLFLANQTGDLSSTAFRTSSAPTRKESSTIVQLGCAFVVQAPR